mmetsp:Transcript_1314/g.3768  ORF Transcript_1314/g.3768 Transcript_1314/m.3768 type:complete len:238 (-) Transcript_1314:33-746(-)
MVLTMKTLCLATILLSTSALQINSVDGDACTCLRWKDAYTNYNMTCDEGEEFCGGFFLHMSGNICVNQGMGSGKKAEQYCFVSPACQQLNGGGHISDKIAMKVCTAADERLVDKTPEEIEALSVKDDLDRGLVVKMAYPILPKTRWSIAKAYLTGDFTSGRAKLTSDQTNELSAIGRSGKTAVIDSNSGHPPFAVVAGSRVYEIKLQMGNLIKLVGGGKQVFEHPSQLTYMTCVSDC